MWKYCHFIGKEDWNWMKLLSIMSMLLPSYSYPSKFLCYLKSVFDSSNKGPTKKRPEQPGVARHSLELEQPDADWSSPARIIYIWAARHDYIQTNKVLWSVVVYNLLLDLFQTLLTYMVEYNSITADVLGSQALIHCALFNWCLVSVHQLLYHGKLRRQR